MRQGSSCTSREPSRCSTYSRNNGATHVVDLTETSANSASVCKGYGLTSSKEAFASLYPNNPTTASFNSSFDGLKALPSRPKVAQGLLHNKQANGLGEANQSRDVPTSQLDCANGNGLSISRPAPAIEVNVARSRCHPRRRPCSGAPSAVAPKLRRDTDCTEAIVRLIVFFSTKLVHTIWSQASATPKSSKDFNGAGVLPLQVFIQETLRRSKTSYSTLQVALFYLILLRPHVRPCQNTQQYPSNCRALQCGRRMFLTALILASKYLQDRNYSARAWSKISGLPVAEINENERHYLELIKYNLHMSKDTFENWSRIVISICKASGQGPFSGRPESPPSSPDGLSSLADFEQPGASGWWLRHLVRLSPEMVKDTKATEDYVAGLTLSLPVSGAGLSLDTPPSSPESLEEVLSDHNSPLVVSTVAPSQVPTAEFTQSPPPAGSMPTRPLPPNLPTPQTTPRHDSAFTFSRQSSQSDLRCRASLQALGGVDKQGIHQANLESCPPPKPRQCTSTPVAHPVLKELSEPSVTAWMSSPESSFSDYSSASSFTTRSRSSSISSVSSVWSVAGNSQKPIDVKQTSLPRSEQQASGPSMQVQSRVNMGSYSYYHPVGNMHAIPENSKISAQTSRSSSQETSPSTQEDSIENCLSSMKSDDLSDIQVAQLLASLSSQSDGEVQQRTGPAVTSNRNMRSSVSANLGPSKKHKRNRPSKEENILQEEVRNFLWNERHQVCVEDDKRSAAYVETSDKEAQYPQQQWAHAKKPVPNAMQNKRMALQHSSSPRRPNAPELAAEYLRQGVAVM